MAAGGKLAQSVILSSFRFLNTLMG